MKYPQLVSMPSAVSDWLEEQLEARGIDAVVYTRYILSLLHSDTVDVIYSDEDLHFTHLKKEVRRPGGSRKRFRRSSDWWKCAQADAEKLKRSAAIECLMSASEQTCGIESLIDELCDKLNEIKSDDDEHHVDPPVKKPELQQVSPQELAKRYYAAFPPLNRNATPTLIPKWIPSPKKKPKHSEMKASRTVGKQRFGAYITSRKKENNEKKPKPSCDELNLYDDLPVDIKELLDDSSPSSNVEMMNLANMRDTGRRGFISSGTNITSSIWTNEAAMEENYDSVLDLQFSSITINNWFDLPASSGRWSDDSGCFEDDHLYNHFSQSLVKLNHDKEVSAFAEVVPKNRHTQYNPFSKIIGSGINRDKKIELEKEEDLLTSVHSHFRPINEKVEGQYADGATFIVSNTWDKINYRRTESGMYMENDYSMRKKYCEYNKKKGTNMDFVLKYLVCQNDKSCQTDDLDAEVEAINRETCTCRTLLSECRVHPTCDKCNNNSWNTNLGLKTDLRWQFGTTNIWSGGSVCHDCLGRPPSTLQHSKLREDVSQDGDQLLSDLSTIHKTYQQESLPVTEFTCDIAEFFLPKERKRRHSLMAPMEDSWSFAERLEEDCLIQMSTIPTLRSVTL